MCEKILNSQEMARQLAGVNRPLIYTHRNPDGDALGSALGLLFAARAAGIEAVAILADDVSKRYLPLLDSPEIQINISREQQQAFKPDAIIITDTARRQMIGGTDSDNIDILFGDIPVYNLDHHPDNSVAADYNLVRAELSSASEVVFELLNDLGWTLPLASCNWILQGIMTDTGGFRFSNTKPSTLRNAAQLQELGANWSEQVDLAFFGKSWNQQLLESEMLNNHTILECDNRLGIALLDEDLLTKYHFSMKDGDMIIERLREIDGVEVCILISWRANGTYRASFRSRNPQRPVGPLARELSGGGHEMASGATLQVATITDALNLIRPLAVKLFE